MSKLPPKRRPGTGRWWLRLLLAILVLGAGACQHTPPTDEASTEAAQATYYTCPMHPQVHADKPGSCPICHMDLVAVRPAPAAAADSATTSEYTCPMHPQVRAQTPGRCPICGMDLVKAPGRPATHTLPNAAPAPNDLILTAQQLELANIQVQPVGAGPAPVAEAAPGSPAPAGAPMVLTGTVTANARRTETVSSRVTGRVEQLYVRQTGQLLRRGEPLFAVYSEQLQTLQREYLLALAQARQAPQPTYQQLADATAQKLRLLGVSGEQLRQLVRRGQPSALVTYFSPGTGTVQTLSVVEGQYVAEGSPILTLTDLSSVWVEAQLYPAEARQLPLGQSVSVQVAGQSKALRGKVVFLSPELSGGSQLTLARIEVPNPAGRLQPGAQANVLLAGPSGPTASAAAPPAAAHLLVPPAAILHDGPRSYVWKQTGERQFRRMRVRLGTGTATAVPVLNGLQPGDQIVVAGAYLLQSEFTLRQGAGDDHMSGMAM